MDEVYSKEAMTSELKSFSFGGHLTLAFQAAVLKRFPALLG